MGVILRGLVLIATMLLVGVIPADAGSPSLTVRASADFDASGKITDQVPKGWISSSSYDQSAGTFVLNFADGLFSKPPNCTVNTLYSKNQETQLNANAFPQPVLTYSDGVVIMDTLTPRKDAHSLPASQVVCVVVP